MMPNEEAVKDRLVLDYQREAAAGGAAASPAPPVHLRDVTAATLAAHGIADGSLLRLHFTRVAAQLKAEEAAAAKERAEREATAAVEREKARVRREAEEAKRQAEW